jgi:hypothetical protein
MDWSCTAGRCLPDNPNPPRDSSKTQTMIQGGRQIFARNHVQRTIKVHRTFDRNILTGNHDPSNSKLETGLRWPVSTFQAIFHEEEQIIPGVKDHIAS